MQGDPRWITAKHPSVCTRCRKTIPRGAEAFYYPNTKSLYCAAEDCGRKAAIDFELHRQDEEAF